MPEQARAVAERAIEIFNREFAAGRTGVSDETRDSWVAEPLIVPFRAALEGNEYSGPSALDEFAVETRESWEWVRIDDAEIRELDESRFLVVGDLVGRGRETGAEARAQLAWIFVVRDGRIAEARTFPGEREALEAGE